MDVRGLIAENTERWHAMRIDEARAAEFDRVAKRLFAGKSRFLTVESHTGVPWWVVAVIFERESGGDWGAYLGNGQPLGKVTTEVPAGRGPFFGADAWERGCYDALMDCPPHASRWKDWSIGGALTLLEQYNGLGYAAKGVPSPYIWSGTDQYTRGKYIRDHVYDPNAVDKQLGCAGLIEALHAINVETHAEPAKKPADPSLGGVVVTTGGTVIATGAAAAAGGVPAWLAVAILGAIVAGFAAWMIWRRRS